MKARLFNLSPLISMVLLLFAGTIQAQLKWRVSIKFFTDSNGNPPGGNSCCNNINTAQAATNRIIQANGILDNTGRGYRYRIVEIAYVSGTTAPLPSSTNSWYKVQVSGSSQDDLDAKAKANKAAFAYRDNAINFYVTGSWNGPNGGYCAFPTESQDVILVSQDSFSDVLVHEAGHYFDLLHTFDSGGSCSGGNPVSGGDDGLADTALDYPCGTRDNVAMLNYGLPYASLNAGQQAFVNSAWLNVMSYHSPGSLFTSDQMDKATDYSNGSRNNVCTGHTRFVDRNGNSFLQFGSSAFPDVTVGRGVSDANNGDIVLIRPGNYNEPGSYTKPVTFRATRGNATIGIP